MKRTMAVILAGEPNASDPQKQREGIPPEEECFPPELRTGVMVSGDPAGGGSVRIDWTARTEPLAADLEGGSAWPLPGRTFGAVVVTNYLHRPLFPALLAALMPGGANTDRQFSNSTSTPCSRSVGTSRISADRCALATPSARSLPDCTCGSSTGRSATSPLIWPPIRSAIAGAAPLYGICSRFTPVKLLNSSPEKWCGPAMPEVPTAKESGFADFVIYGWQGVLAPARTPRAIIDKLSAEYARILRTPDVRDTLQKMGADTMIGSPEQFAAYIKSEIVKWAKIVRDSNIAAQ